MSSREAPEQCSQPCVAPRAHRSPMSCQLTAAELRSGAVVRMAEEQQLARLCKLPTQPSHPHCVSNTYRSAQHSQALLRGLLALRDSGILFDVVLVVEGKQLEAHRILLAASCDYFRSVGACSLLLFCFKGSILGSAYDAVFSRVTFPAVSYSILVWHRFSLYFTLAPCHFILKNVQACGNVEKKSVTKSWMCSHWATFALAASLTTAVFQDLTRLYAFISAPCRVPVTPSGSPLAPRLLWGRP